MREANSSQKALNLFNAALVTPTYYVYFTSTTIITSAVLFQGFKGTVQSIVTVVMGFLTICAGVVLLQLSKSAKDVPDAAVFSGDLDQMQTIAEQEQPETEPKADAIRGTAAIIRRISQARNRMEAKELKRLHEEKQAAAMEPISEDGVPQYEWDGLRRRRTTVGSRHGRSVASSHPTSTTPFPPLPTSPLPPVSPSGRMAHPPLGMSQFPEEDDEEEPGIPLFSNLIGTIRGRGRTNATMPTWSEDYGNEHRPRTSTSDNKLHSPLQPVPLTEIKFTEGHRSHDDVGSSYFGRREQILPAFHQQHPHSDSHIQFADQDTEYRGHLASSHAGGSQSLAPTPPPHGGQQARRQFSFQKVFKRSANNSEEERVGLVKDDSNDEERPDSEGSDDDADLGNEKRKRRMSWESEGKFSFEGRTTPRHFEGKGGGQSGEPSHT